MDELLQARPRHAGHVDWAELDGEVVLFNERTAQIRVLSPTAGLVWRLLDGEASLAELAHDLAAELDADEGQVRADVVALARRLLHARLLET
jgi:hypothetical protein